MDDWIWLDGELMGWLVFGIIWHTYTKCWCVWESGKHLSSSTPKIGVQNEYLQKGYSFSLASMLANCPGLVEYFFAADMHQQTAFYNISLNLYTSSYLQQSPHFLSAILNPMPKHLPGLGRLCQNVEISLIKARSFLNRNFLHIFFSLVKSYNRFRMDEWFFLLPVAKEIRFLYPKIKFKCSACAGRLAVAYILQPLSAFREDS